MTTTALRPGEADAPTGREIVASAIDLRKIYGTGDATFAALDGVSLDFLRGEFTAVMGPSGSGKSTLLHCMAALDSATSGRVVLDGVELASLKEKELTRVGFGVALQRSLVDQGIDVLGVPWLQLGGLVGVAAVVGMAAAVVPARRAAHLDVLAAVAHE